MPSANSCRPEGERRSIQSGRTPKANAEEGLKKCSEQAEKDKFHEEENGHTNMRNSGNGAPKRE